MGKKVFILLVVALIGMLVLPALASATLVNEYGMHFAGQATCVDCHSKMPGSLKVEPALHGKFATSGISPGTPSGWAEFRAAGNIPEVAGTGQSMYASGGSYAFKMPWITLGDSTGNSATEYLFFRGSTDPTVMPWNIVEGLAWEPSGEWEVGDGVKGLWDESYGCQRCHMLGTTMKGAAGKSVPNPAASWSAVPTTAVQWAREEGTTVDQFMSDPAVSMPGLGIQCEQCHGTGQYDATNGHTNTKVVVSSDLQTMGQSQVCGQCHGSYTNLSTTLGIYGYTTNRQMRDFVDINGVTTPGSGPSVSPSLAPITYTTIPSEDDFALRPTAYWMYPNGSNAKGGHYYYNEWAASAHSYRAALTKTDPDAMAFQAAGNGHYANSFDPNLTTGCYKCHTGEGYLQTKGAPMAQGVVLTKDNVGKLGQECVTCHNGHPSAVGAEDVVREPDQAGERSAKGLSVSNKSICEDCHNWQMEVLGTTPNPAPMADIAAHGGASHPQRETLHARSVMYDVADGKAFMPGAKCEDCHMPKTNKAANRISHGMKPMLPADAEKWQGQAKYTAGEDSCSGCHPSSSREELQASIDEWQAAAEEQAAAVVAAINMAKTKSEFSATDKTKAGYVLVARATWNYKAYENDASGSVHNPRYILAGLEKAEQEALSVGGKYSYVAASKSVKKNKKGHVAGVVLNGNGTPAAGAAVTLKRGAKVLRNGHADENGHFAFTFKVTKTYKNYKVKWARSGSAATDRYSKALTIKCVRAR
jgi:formate-dependent nitrite reductase cytochrome c552 subunit